MRPISCHAQDAFPTTKLGGTFCSPALAFWTLECAAVICHCALVPGVSVLPLSALLQLEVRSALRKKYNIEGKWYHDLCISWWCAPCGLAQLTREVIIRNAAEQQGEL